MSEDDMNNRVPNPEFIDHYKFELEVLSVNKTDEVKISQLKTYITYIIPT